MFYSLHLLVAFRKTTEGIASWKRTKEIAEVKGGYHRNCEEESQDPIELENLGTQIEIPEDRRELTTQEGISIHWNIYKHQQNLILTNVHFINPPGFRKKNKREFFWSSNCESWRNKTSKIIMIESAAKMTIVSRNSWKRRKCMLTRFNTSKNNRNCLRERNSNIYNKIKLFYFESMNSFIIPSF